MSPASSPLVSIIVAVFNGKGTLQQCIDSVAQQSYPNKELIVIDGGSKDGTVNLLHANQEKISYWVSEPDRGIYNAWNKGLALAKGEWICFLGADDYLWDSTVLERMSAQLVALPSTIRVAYGQIMMIRDDGQAPYPIGTPWEQVKDTFMSMSYMNIPHVGTMHRRSLFEQHGMFDESFKIAGDYELLLRELTAEEAAFIPDLIVAGQRLGGISTESASYLKIMREVWRAQRMHGQLLPRPPFIKQMAIHYSLLLVWSVFGDQFARKLLDLRRRLKGLPPHWTKN